METQNECYDNYVWCHSVIFMLYVPVLNAHYKWSCYVNTLSELEKRDLSTYAITLALHVV